MVTSAHDQAEGSNVSAVLDTEGFAGECHIGEAVMCCETKVSGRSVRGVPPALGVGSPATHGNGSTVERWLRQPHEHMLRP